MKYLKKIAESKNEENLDIVFYSDNCCGQHKNKFIMGMYLYAVQNFKIRSITHKFLIRGHTQNEGDNVHSVIEKAVKRALKLGPIYIPGDYVRIIQSARKTGNPYIVSEMCHDDFMDLKNLTQQLGSNFNKTSDNDTIKTGDIKVVRVQKSEPSMLYVKTSYEQKEYKKIKVNNTRRRQGSNLSIKQAYMRKLVISDRKKSDIEELLKANLIPKSYKPIYDSIFL